MEQIRKLFLLVMLFFSARCLVSQNTDSIARLLINNEISNLDSLTKDSDVLEIIESLLSFKGDKKTNADYDYCTNSEEQDIYIRSQSVRHPVSPSLTNQFIALYLINALFYEDFEFADKIVIHFYLQGEVMYFTNTKRRSIPPKAASPLNYPPYPHKNRICRNLFDIYHSWFNQVKVMGLDKARETNFSPLSGSIYSWGVDKTSK